MECQVYQLQLPFSIDSTADSLCYQSVRPADALIVLSRQFVAVFYGSSLATKFVAISQTVFSCCICIHTHVYIHMYACIHACMHAFPYLHAP